MERGVPMLFRKAGLSDVDAVSAVYEAIHDREEAGQVTTGWIRGVYPTAAVARAAVAAGDLFVAEEDGRVIAAARINRVQGEEYLRAAWQYTAPPEQVMVLHTLVVWPEAFGKGVGTRFVNFYEEYAAAHRCPFLRLDTNARNVAARALYQKLGYREASVVDCVFNGIPGVQLVCLEKRLAL